jgi:ParB family transcriptional regulator, chromosome partitioning protein
MARKNLLDNLMGSKLPAGNPSPETKSAALNSAGLLASQGAIGAVSRSIEQLKQQAADSAKLQERLEAGEAIVELDPALIDHSLVPDRMQGDGAADDALRLSIAEQGQQVPILVRPHPGEAGRYQIAYGHRRLRAMMQLGKPVRAVVRRLSNEDLVIAQGVENSARADLSFIERALYAAGLEKAGFQRAVIMAALNIDKTILSKLVGVATRLDEGLLRLIGPAPKTGRDRWLQLVDAMQHRTARDRVEKAVATGAFRSAESDQRFEMVMKAAQAPSSRKAAEKPVIWRDASGRTLGKVIETDKEISLRLNRSILPGFAEFLRDQMPTLIAQFGARSPSKHTE